jgi:hypothetical protein
MVERKDMLEDEQFDAIEDRLAGTLRRFTPPPDFVTRLRGHIHMPERDEIVIRLYEWERLAVVVAGVLSGAVAILTVARAMYHLFGRRS